MLFAHSIYEARERDSMSQNSERGRVPKWQLGGYVAASDRRSEIAAIAHLAHDTYDARPQKCEKVLLFVALLSFWARGGLG